MGEPDYSKMKEKKLTFWHYVAVWIWVGWITFYICLPAALILIGIFWSLKASLAIILVLVLAMIPTVNPLKQPQWYITYFENGYICMTSFPHFKGAMILEIGLLQKDWVSIYYFR